VHLQPVGSMHGDCAMCQMQDDEAQMAGCIADLQAAMAAMSEDPCNRSRLYLTDRELAALPCMAHDTVFAVRGAAGQDTIHQRNRRCNIKQDLMATH
jgi:hypothetical protein